MPELGKLMYSTDLEDLYEGYVAVVTDITSGNTEQMQIRVFLSDMENVSFKNYMYSEIPSAHDWVSSTQLMIVNGDPQYPNWAGPYSPPGRHDI